MRITITLLLTLGLLACAACDSDPSSPDQPTDADLTLAIYARTDGERGGPSIAFGVNPLGSRDDLTNRPDLDVRWDYEADGVWDTEFAPLAFDDCFLPDPLPMGVWRARVQVRDGAGNLSVAEAEQALPAWVPTGPDLMVGSPMISVLISKSGQYGGYRVHPQAWEWGLTDAPEVVCSVSVDGQVVGTVTVRPWALAWRQCDLDDSWGAVRALTDGVEINDHLTPGDHTITVRIDTTDLVDEHDDANNVYSWTDTFD